MSKQRNYRGLWAHVNNSIITCQELFFDKFPFWRQFDANMNRYERKNYSKYHTATGIYYIPKTVLESVALENLKAEEKLTATRLQLAKATVQGRIRRGEINIKEVGIILENDDVAIKKIVTRQKRSNVKRLTIRLPFEYVHGLNKLREKTGKEIPEIAGELLIAASDVDASTYYKALSDLQAAKVGPTYFCNTGNSYA